MKKTILFCLTTVVVCLIAVLAGAIPAPAQNLIATVPVGCLSTAADVNMVTNKVYVVNAGGATCPKGTTNPSFTVIDGATNSTTTLPLGITPIAVAVNPNTNKIYVTPGYASPCANFIVEIDGATNSTTTVPVGGCVTNLAVNPNTNKIYVVTNGGGPSDSVAVIDGATNSTTSIPVPIKADFVVLNPDTNKIYVVSNDPKFQGPAMLTVIDGATNSTATIDLGEPAGGPFVNRNTNKIYVGLCGKVCGNLGNNIAVVDGATNSLSTIMAGDGDILGVDPETNRIYVAGLDDGDNNDNYIIYDFNDSSETKLFVGTGHLTSLILNAATNQFYGAGLSQLDGATDYFAYVGRFLPALFPIAINTTTNRIYDTTGLTSMAVLNGAFVGVGLQPSSHNFGGRPIDSAPTVEKITLTNTGLGRLTFSDITITGGSQFSQTNNCIGPTLDLNQSCTVNVAFAPTALGSQTAALTVTDNGQASPQNVPLSGIGLKQAVTSPGSFMFGSELVGTTSAAKTVTFTNNLATALPISVSFAGADPGDFVNTGSGTCGSSMPARSHCTISVAFAPKATGSRTATLQVTDSANNSPQTVKLSGTGK